MIKSENTSALWQSKYWKYKNHRTVEEAGQLWRHCPWYLLPTILISNTCWYLFDWWSTSIFLKLDKENLVNRINKVFCPGALNLAWRNCGNIAYLFTARQVFKKQNIKPSVKLSFKQPLRINIFSGSMNQHTGQYICRDIKWWFELEVVLSLSLVTTKSRYGTWLYFSADWPRI